MTQENRFAGILRLRLRMTKQAFSSGQSPPGVPPRLRRALPCPRGAAPLAARFPCSSGCRPGCGAFYMRFAIMAHLRHFLPWAQQAGMICAK